ncbi:hypothetical protein [Kitasatospora sp. NPDC093806]|uniref:hypothetical protein n=1 Tax=Kitasatospora sp. NPDC093806 TaxID=3155075 RepID=UPI00341B67BA
MQDQVQRGWAGCRNCLSLFFSWWPTEPILSSDFQPKPSGLCPGTSAADLHHVPRPGWSYCQLTLFPADTSGPFAGVTQRGFHRCTRCQGLFFPVGDSPDRCWGPAVPSGIGIAGASLVEPRHEAGEEYVLPLSWRPFDHVMEGWEVCASCRLLVYTRDQGNHGACTAGGPHHGITLDLGVEYWRPG